jgi:LPS export ABC transporter protein LptC
MNAKGPGSSLVGRAPGAIAAVLLAAACSPADELVLSLPEPPLPVAKLSDVVFEGYQADARGIEVAAAEASVNLAQGVADLSQVRIEFDEDRRGRIQVRADEARVEIEGSNFVLRGNVRGEAGAGERFATDEIHYDQEARRLWTDSPVRVERASMTLHGEGMELDVPSRRIRIIGRVRVTSVGK